MKKLLIIFLTAVTVISHAQNPGDMAARAARTVMSNWKDSFSLDGKPAKWTYDMAVLLKGFDGLWQNTGDAQYYNYIQKQVDFFVTEKGDIKTYRQDEFNLDNCNNGKMLLLLYRVTLKDKYLKAAKILRDQLRNEPRNSEGGFWHKKIYPNQMWLDGLYMAEPFYAEYAWLSHDDTAFNDIARQFILMEKNARDPKTGLLYHGYDESKQMKWADLKAGHSQNFWARAMGWYVAALVDVLDYFPDNHPQRKELVAILNRLTDALEKQQDKTTCLWKDVLNYNGPGKEKNYFEASASSLFVYAIAKAVRKGYLPAGKISVAQKGYAGILKKFIKINGDKADLEGTVKVSGLGGNPYRDGSFDYYMSEPVITNDPKGVGAFLMASNEMDLQATQSKGRGINVVMDNYFNREIKEDAFGDTVVFHYKWWERDNGGFSFMKGIWNKYGIEPTSLDNGPDDKNMKNVSVYFLIDPDWPKENKHPNYIEKKHIEALVNFVKQGGVMVMMANDTNNVEFEHYNELAERFGIHWDGNERHDVINDNFVQGAVNFSPGNQVFKTSKKAYIKQMCSQTIKKPAESIYSENGEALITISKLGNGIVFAVGDPWFYNEYLDGRKLPAEYENYKAADDLIKWLIEQSKKK